MTNVQLLESPHPFAANTYLVSSGNEYAVIDPTVPYSAELCEGSVKYVLLTHSHFDHILEVKSWVDATGAQVIVSSSEVDALRDPMRNCFKLYNGTDNGYFGEAKGIDDGELLYLGERQISYISLPGHTIGSGAYLFDNCAFVGDTVFAGGGFGRFDLPTGNLVMLRESIKKVLNLADETVLYPGHGEFTTIKQYKQDFRG
ncbi:MAG: MBL fold metallo-hydrolase [Clostridia bacterium]|nr:MBL fold metallo-hydrolase [Clostridia bacterium]